jgi:hypothetical protein
MIQTRQWESSALAEVRWGEGGIPTQALVAVRTPSGQPVAGVRVHVMNESGGALGTTDTNGIVTLQMGEPEFTGLLINDQWVARRRHAYLLGQPNVNAGLTIDVTLKNSP